MDDLIKIKIGITAPSGTNSQGWTFTVLEFRDKVLVLGEVVGSFYERLNKIAQNTILRTTLKLMGKKKLDTYYREYYETVKEGLCDWRDNGKDILFHGSSAVIVIGSKKSASCPHDDALLATQNILLGAHAMGLGTCLIGFVIEASKNDKSIERFLKIPKDEKIYSCIAIGYPDESY